MKTVLKGTPQKGRLRRVHDHQAAELVKEGYVYTDRALWKQLGRGDDVSFDTTREGLTPTQQQYQ